jgi:hypothetical protein
MFRCLQERFLVSYEKRTGLSVASHLWMNIYKNMNILSLQVTVIIADTVRPPLMHSDLDIQSDTRYMFRHMCRQIDPKLCHYTVHLITVCQNLEQDRL